MRRLVLLFTVLVAAAATVGEANLLDTWQQVQENLAAGDAGAAERSIRVLQEQAAELEVWRMPAFAAAGRRVIYTFSPVWSPTPVARIAVFNVRCRSIFSKPQSCSMAYGR